MFIFQVDMGSFGFGWSVLFYGGVSSYAARRSALGGGIGGGGRRRRRKERGGNFEKGRVEFATGWDRRSLLSFEKSVASHDHARDYITPSLSLQSTGEGSIREGYGY